MTRFVLHAGPHKTATTYIQAHLQRHREALRPFGVDYPTEWCLPGAEHCHLGLARQAQRKEWSAISDGMRAIAARGLDTVVLSSEDLSRLNPEELQGLAASIPAPVTIIFYIRAWSGLLPSLAQEATRHGVTLTVPEYVLTHMLRPLASPDLNYRLRLDQFASAFGDDAIRIVRYDQVVESGDNIFRHFLREVLGCSADLPVQESKIHVSSSAPDLELIRMGNVYRNRGHDIDRDWNGLLRSIRGRDTSELLALMTENIRHLTLSDAQESFQYVHRSVMTRYAGNIVGPADDSDGQGAVRQRQKQVAFVHPDYLSHPHAVGQLMSALGIR